MVENIIFLSIKYQLIILCKSGLSWESNFDRPCEVVHVTWTMSNFNSGRRIAMVNVQCSIMIPFIRFTKLQNRPTGMDFDLKVVPKNIPSFRDFWLKILDVYFTGLLRQKAEIELGVEQELDMGYCDEAERVLDTGTVTLLEKVLDTGNFSLIRAEARQWNSFLWSLYLS